MPKKSIDNVLNKLGINKSNGLYYKGDSIAIMPHRIENSLKYIDYDAIYLLDDNPIIIFREFSTFDEYEDNIQDLHKDVWNLSEIPILFILTPNQIFVYNANLFNADKDNYFANFDIDNSQLYDFKISNLSSGHIWDTYGSEFKKSRTVQNDLLDNLKYAREYLHEKEELSYHLINSLIGRILFSRFLVDKGILTENFFLENYGVEFEQLPNDKEKTYEFFDYLGVNFNGDLFPIEDEEITVINKNTLKLLWGLFKGDFLKESQKVLVDRYDFKIIPIGLISNIYETFLNQEQDDKKAYYTPLFLVDYILDQIFDDSALKKDCRILDPSCGSGVFLVESLRRLIEEKYQNETLSGDKLKELLENSIFGIDKDEDAVNIAIFSVCLVLLDYLDPREIEEFIFPSLKDKNFFVDDFFNLDGNFNKLKKFDFVVGNPPWDNTDKEELHKIYCELNNISNPTNQIAQSFLIRASDFIKDNSEVALIVTSKILYNHKALDFRIDFLENFQVDKVLEFSPLRKEIFNNAIGPGVVLFYQKKQDDKKHNIEHISLKPSKLFYLLSSVVIQKFDTKFVPQKDFIEDDWIWKGLLYGSFLDIQLLQKIRRNRNIGEYITENGLLKGKGVTVNPLTDKINASDYVGVDYLDISPSKKMLQRYYIKEDNVEKWTKDSLHRPRDSRLFEPPNILIKKGPDSGFRCVSTFSNHKWIFTDSIFSIKGYEKNIFQLKNILGILNSSLFTYYSYLTFSSLGVEREQLHETEIVSMPIIENEKIIEYVDCLLDIDRNKDDYLLEEKKIQNDLDEYLFSLFKINNLEKDLIDYTVNIAIPMYKSRSNINKILAETDNKTLKKYANVFSRHFKAYINKDEELFNVKFYKTPQFVLVLFSIDPIDSNEIDINNVEIIEGEDNFNSTIDNIGILSMEERNSFYIQRDIKGFEGNVFYVIKPNELKNWHPAVARLDIIDFMQELSNSEVKNV
ncbi:hypothetical protein SDC9_07612 [bioreactor metagenome]|uniref:site-specific DNA-methyltransferase (adenine-specific) n=1 Tax=bioreactor metagenome TaxID=1076179 RepID=A0A644T752_9ZZZZ|nr:N-6 DNA methylase [Methanobrevibacter sp.]MEA4957733.1 N-6 DNA methylase [Methanobrevibacter sp.]